MMPMMHSPASMAAAHSPRMAVYCRGPMPKVMSAERQRMELDAKIVMQRNVSRKRRMENSRK